MQGSYVCVVFLFGFCFLRTLYIKKTFTCEIQKNRNLVGILVFFMVNVNYLV